MGVKRIALKEKKKISVAPRELKMRCKILIVCEGAQTEPNYFDAFKGNENFAIYYDVIPIGTGLNTIGVVDKAIELRDKKPNDYDVVWAVFDRDSFSPDRFCGAIKKAEASGIRTAWSNEAFELWYLLHFQYRNTAMSRVEYKAAISKEVNAKQPKGSKKYTYEKNYKQNRAIMLLYGNEEEAISRAITLHKSCCGEDFHTHNPCTTVYQLVLQLLDRDKKLKKEVTAKIDAQP